MENKEANVEGLFNYNDLDAIKAQEHEAIMKEENRKRQREKEQADEIERQRLEALEKFKNMEMNQEQEVTNTKQKTVIKLRS